MIVTPLGQAKTRQFEFVTCTRLKRLSTALCVRMCNHAAITFAIMADLSTSTSMDGSTVEQNNTGSSSSGNSSSGGGALGAGAGAGAGARDTTNNSTSNSSASSSNGSDRPIVGACYNVFDGIELLEYVAQPHMQLHTHVCCCCSRFVDVQVLYQVLATCCKLCRGGGSARFVAAACSTLRTAMMPTHLVCFTFTSVQLWRSYGPCG